MYTKIMASLLFSTCAFAAEQEKVEEMGVTQISSKVSSLQINEAEIEPADSPLNTATLVEDDETETETEEEIDSLSVIENKTPESEPDDPEAPTSDIE